ncbi:MAG: exonuclease subunit SbcD [Muribaculaceae bacterium]|nr:exonuclease subunit SbcD [Muribaculaceae bacterium]
MKVLHTSDWHLGQSLYDHERVDEQRDMLRQLAEVVRVHHPDVMVVSGDVFHTAVPPAWAQRIYVEGLLAIHAACPEMTIVVTAGNHDSASRLEANGALWRLAGVTVVGGLARDNEGRLDVSRHIVEIPGKGFVVALPHAFLSTIPAPPTVERDGRMAWLCQTLLDGVAARNTASLPVVLMAHAAIAGSDFTGHDQVGMSDTFPFTALGTGYDYVALGHIHRPQTLADTDDRVRYCGTPIAVSFDEQCEHSVSLVTLTGHQPPQVERVRITNLIPLHTFPVQALPLEEALAQLQQFDGRKRSYVRFHVHADGTPLADAMVRASPAGVTDINAWRASGNANGYVVDGVIDNGDGTYSENTICINPEDYWYEVSRKSPELFIYDNSYIKCRELTLSLDFPKEWLDKKGIVKHVGISFVARNPFIVWKNIKDIDPDAQYNTSGLGLEYGSLPSRRSYGMNFNIKF